MVVRWKLLSYSFFNHLVASDYDCITISFIYNTKSIFMKTDIISTRVDHHMKTEFTHVCEEIGLSPSQAIKLFAKAVINYGGIPFELKIKQPNIITVQAIQELEEGKGHKVRGTSELFDDLHVKLKNA